MESFECDSPLTTWKAHCSCGIQHDLAFEICCPCCNRGTLLFSNRKNVDPRCLLTCFHCSYTFCSKCLTMIHSKLEWSHSCELPIESIFHPKDMFGTLMGLVHIFPDNELKGFSKRMMFLARQYQSFSVRKSKVSYEECMMIRVKCWQALKRDLNLYQKPLYIPDPNQVSSYFLHLMFFEIDSYMFGLLWSVQLQLKVKSIHTTAEGRWNISHIFHFIALFHKKMIRTFLDEFILKIDSLTFWSSYLFWRNAFLFVKDFCQPTWKWGCPGCFHDVSVFLDSFLQPSYVEKGK